jgi:hypothetical protein
MADFMKRAKEMKSYFVERGFKAAEDEKNIQEVWEKEREETLRFKEKVKNDRVPFVIQYHPRLRALGKIMHKYFYLLKSNDRLKKAFTAPSIVAF